MISHFDFNPPTHVTSYANVYIVTLETMVCQAWNSFLGMVLTVLVFYTTLSRDVLVINPLVEYTLHIVITHHNYITVYAYLLTTNINGSPTAGHFLHVLYIIISWVPFTPVDPSWDDGRGRREAGWTLHEQPPNAVAGESGFSALYSRGNPLAYITLELGLPIMNAKSYINDTQHSSFIHFPS